MTKRETGKAPQEILKLFKQHKLPENFCIIPFVNMIFNPGGSVSVCRQKGTEHQVGHLDENSIEDIWNNSYMQKWRNEFLTGEVKICKKEMRCSGYNLDEVHPNPFMVMLKLILLPITSIISLLLNVIKSWVIIVSPSLCRTSVICVIFRDPSLNLKVCTTTSIELLIILRTTGPGRVMPPIATRVSSRASASRGVLA